MTNHKTNMFKVNNIPAINAFNIRLNEYIKLFDLSKIKYSIEFLLNSIDTIDELDAQTKVLYFKSIDILEKNNITIN